MRLARMSQVLEVMRLAGRGVAQRLEERREGTWRWTRIDASEKVWSTGERGSA
jgi:hypothetical protein